MRICRRIPAHKLIQTSFNRATTLPESTSLRAQSVKTRHQTPTLWRALSSGIVFWPSPSPSRTALAAISDAISRAKRALPYPARMFFSRSIVWIGKKIITYCLETPFIPISANLVVFCRSVTRPVRSWLGQVLYAKSHQNRTEMAWKIACVNGP